MSDWESYLKNNANRFVSELVEFVNIPSVSADIAYKNDVQRAGEWVANRLKVAGLKMSGYANGWTSCCLWGLAHATEKPTFDIWSF